MTAEMVDALVATRPMKPHRRHGVEQKYGPAIIANPWVIDDARQGSHRAVTLLGLKLGTRNFDPIRHDPYHRFTNLAPATPLAARNRARLPATVQEHFAGGPRPGEHDADTGERSRTATRHGGDVNPAEVLTTLQKADISFRMMLQIRNKLVQAYQEVNNIRI